RITLNGASDSLDRIYEHLSTGSKINRAGDDAAGLVISQNMEAQIRSSKQAMANIQNANSFLTVTEDSMDSVSDHIQRVNDLLTNMAHDTNDIASRTAAVEEIIERLDEINRLAESTTFNGMYMLSGNVSPIIIQMGSTADTTSIFDISPAMSDLHVKSLDIEMPGSLFPGAKTVGTGSDAYVIVPNPKNSSQYIKLSTIYDKEPTVYTGDVSSLPNAFEPTNANCRSYMEKVQAAVSKLAKNRGLIGAYENRLQSCYDAMSSKIESLEEAKVPYTDTDVAEASSEMVKKQILQQINVSVLAQTNMTPQLALSLLG
ncbi:flagellin, partial [bacterium]|nr:flagellin [bacterium]